MITLIIEYLIDPEFYHTQIIKRQQLTRKNKSR